MKSLIQFYPGLPLSQIAPPSPTDDKICTPVKIDLFHISRHGSDADVGGSVTGREAM